MRREGFTLIELLVVVALSAVLMTVGFVYLGGYRSEQNLKLSASELLATVKNTQRLSMSQQSGMKWGMRFRNTTSSAGQSYTVFSGTSYGAGTIGQTYPVRRNISFSNPWASSTIDTIFNAVSGSPSQPQVISLVDGRQDSLVNDIIVNSLGQITSRFDTGLVGYWHFDENTSTTVYDASGRGNNGSESGVTWKSGSNCKVGNCLGFDTAAQEYVSISNVSGLDVHNTLTLVAWIYPTGVGGTDSMGTVILGNGSYYLSFNDSSNALSCYWYDTVPAGYHTTPSGSVPLNQWSNIACVWDGSNINEYINGVLRNTVAVTGSGRTATGENIGAENVARQFQGYIDEVRIYNRALSATEISDIYNSTR